MPGFNTRDFDDWDIFYRLVTAMSVISPAEKILTWLSLFCGTDYMPNVTIVITKWDTLNEDGVNDQLDRVNRWKHEPLLQPFHGNGHGAKLYYHGLSQADNENRTLHIHGSAEIRSTLARHYIAERYRDPTTLELRIYHEIANGIPVDRTAASRFLRRENEASSNESTGASSSSSSSHKQQEQDKQPGQNGTSQDPSGESSESGFSKFWEGLQCKDAKDWVDLFFQIAKFYFNHAGNRTSFNGSPPVNVFYAEQDPDEAFFTEDDFSSESQGWGVSCVIL